MSHTDNRNQWQREGQLPVAVPRCPARSQWGRRLGTGPPPRSGGRAAGEERQRWLTPSSCRRPSSGTDTTLTFETGKLAFQSQGAVVATLGRTQVLVTANAARNVREGIDFFPLTVDVEERMYAAGRIPGSFFRREGRPTDLAILTCRLIDRPLRPSFADGYRNETQVVVTVMGVDGHNPYDVLAINGASAALMVSGIPFEGPIGAVRIAWSAEGTLGAAPHLRAERGLHLRARGRRSPARRRRHRHHDGRGRRHRGRPGTSTRTAPRT